MPVRPEQLRHGRLGAGDARRDCRVRSACARMTSSRTNDRVSRSRTTGSSIAPLSRASATSASSSRRKPTCWPSVATPRSNASVPIATRQPSPTLADHEVGCGARAVEEDLVELRRAGELHDRPDLDARLLHRHEQVGQPVVPLGAGFGAREHEAPVGQVCQRGPDLLAGDRPLVAVEASPWSRRRPGPSRRRARSSPGTTARRQRLDLRQEPAPAAPACRRRSASGRAAPRPGG